jgi:hypothetical protein
MMNASDVIYYGIDKYPTTCARALAGLIKADMLRSRNRERVWWTDEAEPYMWAYTDEPPEPESDPGFKFEFIQQGPGPTFTVEFREQLDELAMKVIATAFGIRPEDLE